MPGQAAGDAVADILYGKVNPSARLPLTFPNKENEQNFSPAQYPGLPDPEAPLYSNYTEGLFVGYRYYDEHEIKPAFAFGHGKHIDMIYMLRPPAILSFLPGYTSASLPATHTRSNCV